MSSDNESVKHCEIINIIIRGGPDYKRPGDPFTWVCNFIRTGKDSGYALAMLGSPNAKDFRKVKKELKDLGFYTIEYDRISGKQGKFIINKNE